MLLPPEALVREVVDAREEAHSLELVPATLVFFVVAKREREVLWAVDEARRIDGFSDVDVGREFAAHFEMDVDDVVEVVELVASWRLCALALELGDSPAALLDGI